MGAFAEGLSAFVDRALLVYKFRSEGLFELINDILAMAARRCEGRDAKPSAGVLDSQSVKTTESGGPRGYDAGKKVKGRKRHIVTDTLGFLLTCIVHEADVQDRAGVRITIDDGAGAISFTSPFLCRWRLSRRCAR